MAALRRLVKRAVQARSLRGVAMQIGMSAPGLQHFLNGGNPMFSTRRKLDRWYMQHGAELVDTGAVSRAEVALWALLEGIAAGPEHERARAKVLRVVAETHRESGGEAPSWVKELLNPSK